MYPDRNHASLEVRNLMSAGSVKSIEIEGIKVNRILFIQPLNFGDLGSLSA